ncbi:MAG: hypothetical protein Q9217_004286 [Psora testacea]
MVACPICTKPVKEANINSHIDSACRDHIDLPPAEQNLPNGRPQVSSFFRTPSATKKEPQVAAKTQSEPPQSKGPVIIGAGPIGDKPFSPTSRISQRPPPSALPQATPIDNRRADSPYSSIATPEHVKHTPASDAPTASGSKKRQRSPDPSTPNNTTKAPIPSVSERVENKQPPPKRAKPNGLHWAQPLAERMRPRTLDEVRGQDLVGPGGVLRGLIESDRVPSMILWGGAGTGKTTIARVVAHISGARFIEINSTNTGVGECKKLFAEAKGELGLTGRKTIVFCDEIHRFSKTQQDVFLGPVEAGVVTLIGATTENPSFKVQSALLSRCRVFTLAKLSTEDVTAILRRALEAERSNYEPTDLVDDELMRYLAAFADGDARTSLNLLEMAMDLSKRPGATKETIKSSLTQTLVYDRAGDQHYDTISAFHKSIRGSDPHAALYYLARMLQSGEDALYIARRMVVIASEDIGLVDNSMLTLATSTYAAAEKVGMPEARINLAHCTVALALSKKSTRAYRGLNNAFAKLEEPGVAGFPIPMHLRNAPTRLMKEMGYGKQYKYNPSFTDGMVKQEYLPDELRGAVFLEDKDFGSEIDEELEGGKVEYQG